MARQPQEQRQFPYQVPTFFQCIGATIAAPATVNLLRFGVYGQIVIEGMEWNIAAMIVYAAAVSRFELALAGPLLMAAAALVFHITFVKLPRMWLGHKC